MDRRPVFAAPPRAQPGAELRRGISSSADPEFGPCRGNLWRVYCWNEQRARRGLPTDRPAPRHRSAVLSPFASAAALDFSESGIVASTVASEFAPPSSRTTMSSAMSLSMELTGP